MATKNCSACGGSGVNNTSISKGVSNNLCSSCGGSGQVTDYTSGGSGGGGHGSCFPAGTHVCTPNGSTPIENINRGDYVMAVDAFGTTLIRRVTKLNSYGARPVSKITFDDTTWVSVTDHHTVKTQRGWMRVRDLRTGDGLVSALDGKLPAFRKIGKIERGASIESVYNIVVEGECTFVAGGIVAHSFTSFRVIRSAIYRLYYKLKISLAQQECYLTI